MNRLEKNKDAIEHLCKTHKVKSLYAFGSVLSDIHITSSRKLVDVRNRIIHGYDSVSDEVVGGIVIRHIPVSRMEIEKLLHN